MNPMDRKKLQVLFDYLRPENLPGTCGLRSAESAAPYFREALATELEVKKRRQRDQAATNAALALEGRKAEHIVKAAAERPKFKLTARIEEMNRRKATPLATKRAAAVRLISQALEANFGHQLGRALAAEIGRLVPDDALAAWTPPVKSSAPEGGGQR